MNGLRLNHWTKLLPIKICVFQTVRKCRFIPVYIFSVCIVFSTALYIEVYLYCTHSAISFRSSQIYCMPARVRTNDEYRKLCLCIDWHGQVRMRIMLGQTVSDSQIIHQLNQRIHS